MQVEIKTIGLDRIEKMLAGFENKAPSVLFNVVNRVASNIRKNISKEVLKKYGIKSADVKKSITTKRASTSDSTCFVRTSGSTIPLYKFRAKPKDAISTKGMKIKKRPKVKAKVLKSSSLKTIKSAFIAKMGSGHAGVFRRKEKSRKIKELHGPSVPQMVSNEEVINSIFKDAEITYNKRIKHEINRILGR